MTLMQSKIEAAATNGRNEYLNKTNEINTIIEKFIDEVEKKLAQGDTLVPVMQIGFYEDANLFNRGYIILEPERMETVSRGVYKTLAESGFTPCGIAEMIDDESDLDYAKGAMVYSEFAPPEWVVPPKRKVLISMFVDFAKQ